jgi:hypothetical protein
MELDLLPQEDYRHVQQPGEHEAFYFAFARPDDSVFGLVRLLFGHDCLLEIVALRAGSRRWAFQQQTAGPVVDPQAPQIFGPSLKLACLRPWQSWQADFGGPLQLVGGAETAPLELALTFNAINLPARYRYGPYQQSEQEVQASGKLRLGAECWEGEWLGYRDHSWGRRPMSDAAGWSVLILPNRLYAAVVETSPRPFCFGRFITQGRSVPLSSLELTPAAQRLSFVDPLSAETGTVQRAGLPLVFYLGQAGHEEARNEPRPGDLLHDEIGTALFTISGETQLGFWEQARRIAQ